MALSHQEILEKTTPTIEPQPGIVVPAVAETAAAFLKGYIDGSTGNVTRGTGFTAARSGAGVYTVTFTIAFSAPPVVVAMCDNNISSGMVIQTTSVSTTVAAFDTCLSSTRVLTDTNFQFIAVSV